MEENLRKKTFYGVLWSYVNKFTTQLLSIVPAMILTRLLSPSEYGLIAMAAIFTNVAYQLADGGFGNALVQKKDADSLDYCSVFYFNLFICGVIYVLLYFLAPLCAEFFNEVRLISIIRISSLGVIFLAFGQVQGIIFKKNIEYKKMTIRNFVTQLVAFVVAVLLAVYGYGVWALVFQGLIQTFMGSCLNWLISDWKPTFSFSLARLKVLFRFGSKTLLSSMLDYGFNKIYDIVIGRKYSAANLALYNRAYSTSGIFKDTFFNVFSGVTFPVFVRMQDDNERLILNIRRFLIIVSMIIFTVMLALFVLAEPLFRFLYSTKWDSAIPFFRIACLASLLLPIVSILESVLLAKGQSGKFLFISIVRKVFVIAVLGITWQFGIEWMMYGQIIVSVCELFLYSHFINKLVKYSFLSLIKDLIPYILVAIFIVLGASLEDFVLKNILSLTTLAIWLKSILRLLLGGIIVLVLFVWVNKRLKLKGYSELLQFIADSIGNNKIITFLQP
ncbi:lipopolysaccharide biosynthesis protein [Bacteroides faecium]|uniref:Lipopolysaccharide biosynthesis protein n=1 Tax=Bacteroides faecium TaxID=2715212 RepID=A0A6H0KP34_9BACE|nr:lipopolysaccharide biosynthesis protein [Bacteroides faecium]QIU95140.1 lipopolysaccharide biosynthesis protein [Bacteroides faecium]